MISRNNLLELIENKPSGFVQELRSKKYVDRYHNSYDQIQQLSGNTFLEKCYLYIYGIKSKGICKCGNFTKFKSFKSGYNIFCNIRCKFYKEHKIKKIKNTKQLRYGNSNYNNYDKYRNTMKIKYGVYHNLIGKYGERKCDLTRLKKYNDLHYNNMEKNKKTKLLRYGNETYLNVEKIKKTNIDKYNYEFPFQSKEIQRKCKQSMIEKYGVEHITQIPEYAEKCHKNMYSRKLYVLPSGKEIYLQGYENYAFDDLLKLYNEDEIFYKKKDMPEIWYYYEGKQHRYYPDFYIPKDNLIIEVKSQYTYNLNKKICDLKFKATEDLKYNTKLLIY